MVSDSDTSPVHKMNPMESHRLLITNLKGLCIGEIKMIANPEVAKEIQAILVAAYKKKIERGYAFDKTPKPQADP